MTCLHLPETHIYKPEPVLQRTSLWLCLPCRELSKELRINVLGYDYSGYGCSTGTPSVSNTIADVNACYQYLLQVKGKKPQDIVIYGQSVGSGPTCDIAASEKGVMGIVLHSPLMSGTLKTQHKPQTGAAALCLVVHPCIYT